MKYRMYFFVPYNISDIQKGIQAGHAALEYVENYGNTSIYHSFITNDKTWIVLNGGTTRDFKDGIDGFGDMNAIRSQLSSNNITHASFREPDLNYALTAICFLADERVWDFENYPEWQTVPIMNSKTYEEWVESIGGEKNLFLRNFLADKRLA